MVIETCRPLQPQQDLEELYGHGRRNPGGVVNAEEHDVIDDAGRLYSKVEKLIGGGKHEAADLTEIRHHVHAIQYAIMANAAARAYPDRYRLRGQAGEYEAL